MSNILQISNRRCNNIEHKKKLKNISVLYKNSHTFKIYKQFYCILFEIKVQTIILSYVINVKYNQHGKKENNSINNTLTDTLMMRFFTA